MAIMIREYTGSEGIQVDWNYTPHNPLNASEALGGDRISPESLMVEIEGIHVGPTRNFTWYMEEALVSSVPTWTKPYLRPLIMHHNEKDGKIIGRIQHAEMVTKSTKSGTAALLFVANVPDKDGKEQINDGRLNTTSIGVIVHDARCSICGQNIAEEGPCEHERGQKYDNKVCYWVIYRMEAKELSYVIVPSDIYAQNTKVYKPTEKNLQEYSKGVFNLSIAESALLDENGNPKPGEQLPADPPANPPVAETVAKSDYEALEAKYKDLEKTVETQKEEIATLKAAGETANKNLEDTVVLLDTAKKEVKSAQDKLVLKEAELINEKTIRESAENNVITMTTQIRESMVDNILDLRQALGKGVVAKEELEKRSDDSLKDAIKDLKEEMATGRVNPVTITPAANPSIIESGDNSKPNVNKDKNTGNIDLSEGLEKILSSIMGSKSTIN